MADVAILAAYAVAISSIGAYMLARQSWLERSPRAAIAVWGAALGSVFMATVFAGALLALDSVPIRDALEDLLTACLMAFHRHYADMPVASAAGVVLLGVLLLWLLAHAGSQIVHTHRLRRRHRALLDVIGKPDTDHGVTVIDHPSTSAYCLPGDGGRIVITSAAFAALSSEQLAAVIAHERAHLAGRHHLLTGIAGCLGSALPFVPLARMARDSIAFLVERAADERACRRFGRQTVAAAMLIVGSAAAPGSALGAGGGSTSRRIRFLAGLSQGSTRHSVGGVLLAVLLVLTPIGLALNPAAGLNWQDHCVILPKT